MRSAIATIVAAAVIGPACGSAQDRASNNNSLGQKSAERISVAPSFASGKSYRVSIATGTKIITPRGETEAEFAVESIRQVETGGTFKAARLTWTESVDRVRVTGDVEWDSRENEPPPSQLATIAAIAGSQFRVEVDARGAVFVQDLQLPLSAIPEDQREAVRKQLGGTETLSQTLANSVFRTLSDLPRRETTVGETWTATTDMPNLSPGSTRKTRWTLKSIDGDVAVFELAGTYDSKALEAGTDKGRAIYDLSEQTFTELDVRTEFFLPGGSKTVTTTQMRVSPMATSSARKTSPPRQGEGTEGWGGNKKHSTD